jgi:secreted trypsin-like serine protease
MVARGMGVHQRVRAYRGVAAAVACLVLLAAGAAEATVRRDRAAIVGGTAASEREFGFMALVLYRAKHGFDLCSGTLVASNVVLTAGHCAVDETTRSLFTAAHYRVITGSVHPPAGAVVSDVSQVIPAPAFNPRTDASDAALLVLSAPVAAPTVQLATPADANLQRDGGGAVVAGWGERFSGSGPSQQLEWASATIQSTKYCGQFGFGRLAFHPGIQLCTVNFPHGDTGICRGDSGGPLLAAGPAGQPVEVGISVLAPYDCDTVLSDVYTSVAPVAGWIQNELQAVSTGTGSPSRTPLPRATSHPPRIPQMTFAYALRYTLRTLSSALGERFTRRASYQSNCVRVAWPRVRCDVRFVAGPRFYYGQVDPYWVRATRAQIAWNSFYVIHWVETSCYRSRHRRGCTVHTNKGF